MPVEEIDEEDDPTVDDDERVWLELRPYDVLSILSFLREFNYKQHPQLAALGEAVDNFEQEVCKHVTPRHIADAKRRNQVNALIGRGPNIDKKGDEIG